MKMLGLLKKTNNNGCFYALQQSSLSSDFETNLSESCQAAAKRRGVMVKIMIRMLDCFGLAKRFDEV